MKTNTFSHIIKQSRDNDMKRAHYVILILGYLLIAWVLAGCSGGGGSADSTAITPQGSLQGLWDKTGYGYMIDVSQSSFTAYDYTSVTCVRHDADDLDELRTKLDTLAEDGSEFTLRDAPIGFVERYTRADALPATCRTPIGQTPVEIFEHVWHTFNEYYAFFEERNVDWLAQYDSIRDVVRDDMTDADLFEALSILVEPIDDVHVSLKLPDGTTYSPGSPKGFFQDFIAEFEQQTMISDIETYFSVELNTALSIIDSVYLDDEFREAGGPTDDFFKWGLIGDDIGYLSIGAFILQFDRTIADQLIEVENVIDQALTDLQDTQALIVDVRLTPGGADPIALGIANRFADAQRLAMQKQTRTIEGLGALSAAYVEPGNRVSYRNPVIVLTSGFSASATEVFTLAMRALTQVTLVGEPTIGALSDILSKPLPNNWQFELANEVYTDAEGSLFEAIGIPPHVSVSAFGKAERDIGQDSALNAALVELGVIAE